MKKILIGIVVLAIILVVLWFGQRGRLFGGQIVSEGAATNSFATASTSDPLPLISANSARNYLQISVDNDDSALVPIVYLFFDNATESYAYGQGLRLTPGQSWTMPGDAIYTGAIWGIASPSEVRINYIEY